VATSFRDLDRAPQIRILKMSAAGVLSHLPQDAAEGYEYLISLTLTDGSHVEVWIHEGEQETWGRVPGHKYTVMNEGSDGSLILLHCWRVTETGLLQSLLS
jgi:hypothetical protein